MATSLEQKYARAGHPSIQELKAAQGTVKTANPRELFGAAWPEEEKIDDFLAALHEWRGHSETDQAA
jgi:hypothetical protein